MAGQSKPPAIDRLATRGVTFTRHYAASLPCMPARRDMMTGIFAKDISITNGRITYTWQPLPDSIAYHHTLMPGKARDAEYGDWLPHADGLKLFRIPRRSARHHNAPDHNLIYDLVNDPSQEHPIVDDELETVWAEKLARKLSLVGAPAWQFTRMGLSAPAPE